MSPPRAVVVTALATLVGNCAPTATPDLPHDDAPSSADRALPTLSTDAACDAAPVELTLCEWATSTGVLFIGEITTTTLLTAPIVLWNESTSEHDVVDASACSSVVQGLVLELDVRRTLFGPPASTRVVRVGAKQASGWWPMPVGVDNGVVQWRPSNSDAALVPGQVVGIAAHFVDDFDVWSLMGERLFAFSDDALVFQDDLSECPSPLPEEAIGMTEDELAGLVDVCDPDEGKARAASMRMQFGLDGTSSPAWSVAAHCITGEP